MNKRLLLQQQLNRKMQSLANLKEASEPSQGWLKTIRTALGISLQQVGNKLGITKQGVLDIEKREQSGAITINALREVAKVLDMQFVYGFVPNATSLDALIEQRATELATQIVMRTAQTMSLEDQANTEERLQNAIKERASNIINEMPKLLWD
jgi:predicted DNA-binding mobile mystery protein A